MRYYENITLDQLKDQLGTQQYLSIVQHNSGWLVFFCSRALTQYQNNTKGE